jgi:hypothetical protein
VGLLFYKERGHFDDLLWLDLPSQMDQGDTGLLGLLRDFQDKLSRKGGKKEKIAGWVFVVHQELSVTPVWLEGEWAREEDMDWVVNLWYNKLDKTLSLQVSLW